MKRPLAAAFVAALSFLIVMAMLGLSAPLSHADDTTRNIVARRSLTASCNRSLMIGLNNVPSWVSNPREVDVLADSMTLPDHDSSGRKITGYETTAGLLKPGTYWILYAKHSISLYGCDGNVFDSPHFMTRPSATRPSPAESLYETHDIVFGDVVFDANPIIKGADDKTITVGDVFDPKADVTASDKEDGDLTSKIQISGSVDTSKTGSYELTYTVSDSAGNKTEVKRVITVTPMLHAAMPATGASDGPLLGGIALSLTLLAAVTAMAVLPRRRIV